MNLDYSALLPSLKTLAKPLALILATAGLITANVSCASPEPLRVRGYQLFDLGTLGGATSSAASVDESGLVVGESLTVTGARRAFLWCETCDMLALDTLQNGSYNFATAISDNGALIVGNSGIRPALDPQQFPDIRQGFVWDGVAMQSVGALYNPATFNRRFGTSEALGVNDLGQVVGFSIVLRQNLQSAYLWQNGVMTDIGHANDDASSSRAYDINNSGHVVGDIVPGDGSGASEAFLWIDGVFQFLPALPGYSDSTAVVINDTGTIAGWAASDLGTSAVVWSGTGVAEIGTLDGDESSRALGINNRGQVVGWSGTAGNSRAFIWQGGTLLDLNSFLPADSGWVLTIAADINNQGMITGTGLKDGQQRAFLVIPPSAQAGQQRILTLARQSSHAR